MGSSPIAGTILFCWLPVLSGGVAKWLNAVDCKSILSEFGGSNPSPPTILLGYSQAVRHQTLTLASPWSESRYPSHICDPLAQVVEQLTFNQWVEGSSPLRVTIYHRGCSSMVELQPSKLTTWVRFPSSAPIVKIALK